jgi:hypothetical protein
MGGNAKCIASINEIVMRPSRSKKLEHVQPKMLAEVSKIIKRDAS